jgi:hypothetical protein
MQQKFKIGNTIQAIEKGFGFENAVVLDTFTQKKGKFKGKEMYLLKIPCGTATIPVSAEKNYKVIKKK